MKKLATFVFALLLGASLSLAQTGGSSSTGKTGTGTTTTDSGKKGSKGGKKGHKGGKKHKKGQSDTTTTPK